MAQPLNPTVAVRARATVVVGSWLLVGTLDLLAAIINYLAKGGTHPEKILVFIASGVFGKAGLAGGSGMVWWGVVFHYLIAGIWTLLFFLAYPRIAMMRRHWVATGVGYGIVVWGIMTRIVLPLSHTPALPFKIDQAMLGAAILVAAVGLPLSRIAHAVHRQAK